MQKLLVSIILSLVLALGCSSWNRMTPASLDNSAIESEIRKNLATDHLTDVKVDINDGVVTLTGYLHSTADRQKAYDDAMKVAGVKTVVNNIAICPVYPIC